MTTFREKYHQNRNLLKLHHRKWHWKRKGLIFLHVPKAAGTSVSQPLYGRFLGHYTAQQIFDFDPSLLQTIPSFGVVRNPWDRCVSAFRFARRPALDDNVTPSINAAVRDQLTHFESFDSFVHDWLSVHDVNALDYVFQEQSYFLMDGQNNQMVDFVGQVEGMDQVEAWVNSKLSSPVSFQKLNVSGEGTDYRAWYNTETKALVNKIYGRDVSNFRYEF